MRTNIDLDEALLTEAARYTTGTSKRAIVHEALAAYVAAKRDERNRLTYRERLQRIRTQTSRQRARPVGAHDIVRQDRDAT